MSDPDIELKYQKYERKEVLKRVKYILAISIVIHLVQATLIIYMRTEDELWS